MLIVRVDQLRNEQVFYRSTLWYASLYWHKGQDTQQYYKSGDREN